MRDVLGLGELHAEVTRKAIKHVHPSVPPPAGKVRVAAPQTMALDTIRLFVITKLAWIRSQQRKWQGQRVYFQMSFNAWRRRPGHRSPRHGRSTASPVHPA